MIDRFAWPWAFWLLAALVPLALAWARPGRRPAALFSAVETAAGVGPTLRARLAFMPAAVRAAALAMLVAALARPQTVDAQAKTTTEGIALQLVVDRSRSMDEPGLLDGREVTRLEAAKHVVAEFIGGNGSDLRGRPGDLIGLIVFGTYADTLCPLVREHKALLDILSRVEIPALQSEGGTAIGDAIALACARLRDAEDALARAGDGEGFELKSKAIVLLTDGENTQGQLSPRQSAQLAIDWGIRLYFIGIRGGASQVINGRRVFIGQEVNERELRSVAESTGGSFWAVNDLGDLRDVYARIDELEKTRISVDEHTRFHEEFARFGVAALVLVLGELVLRWTVFRRLP